MNIAGILRDLADKIEVDMPEACALVIVVGDDNEKLMIHYDNDFEGKEMLAKRMFEIGIEQMDKQVH